MHAVPLVLRVQRADLAGWGGPLVGIAATKAPPQMIWQNRVLYAQYLKFSSLR